MTKQYDEEREIAVKSLRNDLKEARRQLDLQTSKQVDKVKMELKEKWRGKLRRQEKVW